jgi:hypothetical protein
MVVCGQNPAYDHFSCQHQLYYRENRKKMWYDPVFQVTTLNNQTVWRRRHYSVYPGRVAGRFKLSVLDNGVLSAERWTILDCDEDLQWAIFHYVGCAAAAGTSYSGSLVVTPTGQ